MPYFFSIHLCLRNAALGISNIVVNLPFVGIAGKVYKIVLLFASALTGISWLLHVLTTLTVT
jgi:hypothetical protein